MKQIKTYEEYKESGIEWIGKIPKPWKVTRLKNILNELQSGNREKGGGSLDEGVFSLGGEHIGWNGELLLDNPKYISEEFYDALPKGHVMQGDVLLVKDGATIGKTTIIKKKPFDKLAVNEHVFILRAKFNPNFLYYLISGEGGFRQIRMLMRGSAQEGLNSRFIDNSFFPLPSIQEQEKISAFLEDKTKKIEKVLQNKNRQIEILKEYEQITINQLTTQGFSPPKLINSKHKWICSFNSNWKEKKLQYMAYIKGRIGWQGLTTEEYLDSGDYYLITGTDFETEEIDWSNCHYVEKKRYDEDPNIQLRDQDVLITKDGSIGKVVQIKNMSKPATLNSGVFVTRPINNSYIPRYFFWVLKSHMFNEFIEYHKTGSTISHLYQQVFDNFYFPVPSLKEQQQIADYLDEKTSKIRKSIDLIQKEVEKLEEYKKILINEAVTGKIKVF